MTINILGYGVTNEPLVKWLNSKNIKCNIYDDKFKTIESSDLNTFLPASEFKTDSSLCITSPGIPPNHTFFKDANKISEYDFINLLLNNNAKYEPKIIWVSGTNGKTTTTQMLTYLLESNNAKSGGNIGTPLIELFKEIENLDSSCNETLKENLIEQCKNTSNNCQTKQNKINCTNPAIWILETSSFAMHYTNNAKPNVYLLLPIQEDHIDWHNGFEGYKHDKLKVLERMNEDSSAVLPLEFKERSEVKAYKGKIIFYSNAKDLAKFLDINISDIHFKEPFLLDSLLALSGVKLLGQNLDLELLNTFKIGKHRIEEFLDSSGFMWVDDSKGTNTDATLQAIKCYMNKHLYIILGGDDKGADVEPLFKLLQTCEFVRIFTIGKNENKLLGLSQKYNLIAKPCQNLKNAVDSIKQDSKLESKNDFVALLSPAAASLDQFKSYKERGELFKQYAMESNK